ncbi:MAG: tRNA (N6-threonylcarbamoyladenosine(37)-N6)-methyltransferase TrmO [Chloroflexaceae bacterium]|nr:tRNA (N6-threonylcarbamoyladenosine(37)-N6)-methyltransferase TrmO [Chloroflexaceae bacterium]
MNSTTTDRYQVCPIGAVQRTESDIKLALLPPFRPGLLQLRHFSHVIVLWWASQFDTETDRNRLQTTPPYAQERVTGVFATRAPFRPNPIALTTCQMLQIDEEQGLITVHNIDAYDGTPILDLKAYFPVSDRLKEAHLPPWLVDWPEWIPDEGLGIRS